VTRSSLVFPLKRGGTLSLAGTKTFPEGSTWSGTAQVRQVDADQTLIDTLAVTLEPGATGSDPHAILVVAASTQTAEWPLERLRCDIRFADDSDPPVVLPTSTFLIDVKREVTTDA
jgi:hypothetical protein